MTESTDKIEKTLKKTLRVQPEQWELIEQAAKGTRSTANQLVMELAMESLERRRMFSPEAEIRVARASLFAAQAIARDLIAAGKEKDIQEIRDFISTIVPDVSSGTNLSDYSDGK
ncbi:MAG: hypothetical protein OXN16_12625 [Gammaproteobacteria bacterium]|nr:hypothetical protein [Gammaproteobacteria bacterium]